MILFPHHLHSIPKAEAQYWPYMFQPEYLRFLEEVYGQAAWLAVDDTGAVLPLTFRRHHWARLGRIQNPPLRNGEPLSPADELHFQEQLLITLRRQNLCDRLLQPTTNCVFQSVPAGATSAPFGSYRLPLANRSEEEVFATFHPDYRNKIRAAARLGAEVRFGRDELSAFHTIHSATMKASKLYHDSFDQLTQLFDRLGGERRVLCAVVYYLGEPLGGIFIPFTTHSGHYMHGGSKDKIHPPGAIRLLHWEVIRALLRQGVREYDFVGARLSSVEGSKLEFIQRLKSRFGTQLVKGSLWKADIRPFRMKLFDWVTIGRRLTRRQSLAGPSDIIDQERCKLLPQFLDRSPVKSNRPEGSN